jgi:hypothetical protein
MLRKTPMTIATKRDVALDNAHYPELMFDGLLVGAVSLPHVQLTHRIL